jgi:3-hydroxypropionyl-coenzyme A dehydratase
VNTIQLDRHKGVGILTLNRPKVYNAINYEVMDEMAEALRQWQQDDSVKVLMLTGAGEAFASGGDVKEFSRLQTSEEALGMLSRMGHVLNLIEHFGKPTIAAINGYALGGGCELALSCDIRVASEQAKLGLVQAKLGITTGWGSGTRLMSLVSRSQALHWMLTGEKFSAQEGYEAGLLQRVYPHPAFYEHAVTYAEQLALAPLSVIRAYVEMANRHRQGMDREESKEIEIHRCAQLWAADEHHQAVNRFLKR